MAVNCLENSASSLSGGTEFDSLVFLHLSWVEMTSNPGAIPGWRVSVGRGPTTGCRSGRDDSLQNCS